MGVPSKASMSSTVIIQSSMDFILHTVNPMRFGRTGERVAKTPVMGISLFPLGWTLSMALFSGESFWLNQ